MPWNNNGPGPWGNPGGNPGGNQGNGEQGGAQGDNGASGDGGQQPPKSPWGTPGGSGGNRGGGQGGGGHGGGGGSGGGGGRGNGPFGNGPFGPGGPFPDIDGVIRQIQALIRSILPGGAGGMGFGGLWIVVLGVVLLWAGSGFYRVQPDEQGIILRFGAYQGWTAPGLHYHLPWPIEQVQLPAVTRINRTEIGFRSVNGGRAESGIDQAGRNVMAESLMLTGDENIIDIDVVVFWRVRANEASKYLFNARAPQELVFGVAESSMREVIGRTKIQPALTELRAQIESDVAKQTQEILDHYNVGIEVTQVQLQKVDPPAAVVESFRDVQRANTDAERMRNEAESFHNDIVPKARGEAARILAEAQGARQATIAEANGQAQRFNVVYDAYTKAKDITLRRMYLDSMQSVLAHGHTQVIDDKLKGLVPFLSLGSTGVDGGKPPAVPAQPSAGGSVR